MRILCEQQGTEEWHRVKRGVISASCAHIVLMGKGTKTQKNYIESLVYDLEGLPDFGSQECEPWFVDGRYYESFARGWYSWQNSTEVTETGFIVHDDYSWIGCSPDGLIGDDGLVEIKFRKYLRTFKQHSALLENKSVMPQIQTQLFVTGRQWCDYVNYWRDDDNEFEQGSIERILRDDVYIDTILLPSFISLWDEVQTRLRERKRNP
jgi:hypothetical protein